jgi:hypothetical protein
MLSLGMTGVAITQDGRHNRSGRIERARRSKVSGRSIRNSRSLRNQLKQVRALLEEHHDRIQALGLLSLGPTLVAGARVGNPELCP